MVNTCYNKPGHNGQNLRGSLFIDWVIQIKIVFYALINFVLY
jgi:hypothetical protein